MASQRISCLIGAFLVVLTANVTSASKTIIIDDAGTETIAETVCKLTRGSHTQIGRVSTIGKLVAFFKDLPPAHKLASCGEKYSDALDQLQQVVSQSNDNVCSEQKLSLIERFHHDFISRTWRDKQQQKFGKLVAPKILILFFLHYVARVSATCKQSLMNQTTNSLAALTNDPEKLETLDGILRELSTKMGTRPELKGYDDIVLLWSLVDKFPMKKRDGDYMSPPGNRKRMHLKVNPSKADKLEMFQTICSSKLRPVYAASILPVLRLADLGYYLDNEQFSAELAGQPDLRRQIGVAQLCESMLPVKVFKDDTLQSDQMVLMTRDEAGPIYDEGEDVQLPTPLESNEQNSLVSLDALESVNPDDGHLVARRLRANIKARERIFRRLFTMMSQQLSNKVKSLAGKLFFSSEQGKLDVAKVVSDESNEVSVDELEPHNDGSLVRRKRNFFTETLLFLGAVGVVLLWPVIFVAWLSSVGVLMIFGLILMIFDRRPGDDSSTPIHALGD